MDGVKPAENPGLDQLAGLAAATDAAVNTVENPAGVPGAPAAPAAPDFVTEANGMVDMVVALITGYEPRAVPLWSAARKAGVSAALVPVLQKYNFTLGNMPPEITLLVMAGPPLYQSMKIIADGMQPKAAPDAAAVVVKPVENGGAAVEGGTHSVAMMRL